jgi:FtsP/CotA-like multicopper oxidase with cupredoxin domain
MFLRKVLSSVLLLVLVLSLFLSGSNLTVEAKVSAQPSSPVDETKVPHYYGPYPNWALSPLILPDVAVVFTAVAPDTGTGAAAVASVGANGAITGITITNPGSGYSTAPTVSFTPAAKGASAIAAVTLSSSVVAVNVTAPGSLYTAPVVAITGGGGLPDATATAYGSVDSLSLILPGLGYTNPTVDFDMPDMPGGVKATAVVTMNAVGAINGITIVNPGSGYSKAPKVVIRDGTQFNLLNRQQFAAGQAIRQQELLSPNEGNNIQSMPEALPRTIQAINTATAVATIKIDSIGLDTFGAGYTAVPSVAITDSAGAGNSATATAVLNVGAVTGITLTAPGSGYITGTGIKKFTDSLPMLCDPSVTGSCVPNQLGQYIPLAVPDTTTFVGADYFVIALVQSRERMSSSLPASGTLVREYVQLETSENASWSKHIALTNQLQNGTIVPALMPNGAQAYAVDNPHYLGPVIQATKDRPVRIVFYNLLPIGVAGDLFLPVDTTFMGSGMGPMSMAAPADLGSVLDEVRNPICGEAGKLDMARMGCFAETRATLHLHGGITPWISDGTPHQWITPANETTNWPEGVAVRQVPDMVGLTKPANVPDCSAANDGCMTFYYTNQQSARFMFYHDHAWGITRLNVYAGEAAGYLIRDNTETSLIGAGLIPTDEIPLIIQDKTFVPSTAQLAKQDPTWDYSRWGSEGDLWYEHVYMPAENPADPTGMSTVGRWFYGPFFWPPANPTYPPIPNPYYGKDPATNFTTALAKPCDLNDSTTWQYKTDPFCEPPTIPGTPNNSAGMEQFNDTPVVNGTAYPTLTLDPKAYRFRILNAANDRFWNLQWYVGEVSTADPILGPTEVALKAAEVAAAQLDPVVFPTPDTTLSPVGPSWIQIGTEGGFLPAPVVVPNQPTTWITDPTRFDVGNVDLHSLLLGPAERADVVVDFSQFAGKTLILYNDAPAAFPARIPSYDYYTGAPDMSPNAASVILPGYGPNTRTVMQVKINAATPAPAYNLKALQSAFLHKADGSGVFESSQNPIIVGQAGYNSAYGTNFTTGGWCNNPINPSAQCDGFARISEQGGNTFKFDTLVGPKVGVKIEPKALHDEMNSFNMEPFGRMTSNLGVEVVPADPILQNVVLYPFVNPPTEIFNGTNLPTTANIKPIAIGTDGTQIWKFTHNGVDSHPIHFHLYDVQVLNRVTWDNIIIPPEATELGWKDTVRVSPLEDTYFAIRPIIPVLPWEIPNSIRMLNPMMPAGDTSMFNPTDVMGIPTLPIVNRLANFGWEYMLHCHILSHEEMDMMRPNLVAMPPVKPTGLTFVKTGKGANQKITFTWNDNSITETAFIVQATTDNINWVAVGTVDSPLDVPNTHGVRTLTLSAFKTTYVAYRVVAQNTVGYGNVNVVAAQNIAVNGDEVIAAEPPTQYLNEFPSLSVYSYSDPIPDTDLFFNLFLPVISH